jgi:hypothetical protein
MTAVYPPGDPRAELAQPGGARASRAVGDDVLPFQHTELGTAPPDDVAPGGSASWIHRGQNVVVVTTDLAAGDVVERTDVDEVMLIVVASSGPVRVEAGTEQAELTATSIAMIPPGCSPRPPATSLSRPRTPTCTTRPRGRSRSTSRGRRPSVGTG